MFFIPGFVVSTLTFPGVVMHEAAHQLMCRLTGTPVLDVCYFRVGNPSGFVVHGEASSAWKHFLIAVAPFFFNTVTALFISLPTSLALVGKMELQPHDVLLLWLGFSIGMHAIPSSGDAQSLMAVMRRKETSMLLKIVGFPTALIIMIAAALSVVWFDAIYAFGVCIGVPTLWLGMMT